MIIDDLKNLKNYESVNPLFAKVIEFLKNNDLKAMEPGKYEIEGKDLFLNALCSKVPVSNRITQHLSGFIKEHVVNAPGVDADTMQRRISPRFPTWQLRATSPASQV